MERLTTFESVLRRESFIGRGTDWPVIGRSRFQSQARVARVHFLCRLLSGVVFTAVLPHGHVRRPWPLCQKCRWQVTAIHAYTLTPMKSECADYVCSPDSVGTYQGNELTCVEGTPRPQLSLLAEPLWTGSRLKSGNWCARADRKTNKKVQVGNDFFESFPESPLSTESAGDSYASL